MHVHSWYKLWEFYLYRYCASKHYAGIVRSTRNMFLFQISNVNFPLDYFFCVQKENNKNKHRMTWRLHTYPYIRRMYYTVYTILILPTLLLHHIYIYKASVQTVPNNAMESVTHAEIAFYQAAHIHSYTYLHRVPNLGIIQSPKTWSYWHLSLEWVRNRSDFFTIYSSHKVMVNEVFRSTAVEHFQ